MSYVPEEFYAAFEESIRQGDAEVAEVAMRKRRVAVAAEEVDLINSIVFAQLCGDAEALIQHVGELAEKWPR